MEWVDTTTYMQGDRERIPIIWQLQGLPFNVLVHRHIYVPKDVWALSCEKLDIDLKELKHKEIAMAKIEAMDIIHAAVQKRIVEYTKCCNDLHDYYLGNGE